MHGTYGMEALFNFGSTDVLWNHSQPSLPSTTTLRKLTFVKQP